ncbi:MAG: helicase-related protein [Bacteroides sp.]|nr:helicase-related protein [Bacteroides sp.]
MPDSKDKIKKLYDTFVSEGYEMESEEDFRKNLADPNKRKSAYDALVSDGYDMESFGEFEANIGFGSKVSQQEPQQSVAQQEAAPTKHDEPWKPTEQEKAEMNLRLNQIGRNAQRTVEDFNRKADNLNEYGSRFGSGNTVESKPEYDAESGEIQNTYLTPAGNRYNDKGLADLESFQYRQAADMSVGGQLRKANRRLQQLQQDRLKRSQEINAGVEKEGGLFQNPAQVAYYASEGDKALRAIDVAIHQTEEQIKTLEEQQDRESGVDVGFWRGFGRTAGDLRTWAGGLADIREAGTLLRADELTGENATEGERKAHEAMMQSLYERQQTDAMYGGNGDFWYRAGTMTGEMIPFMIDFCMTGGGYEGFNAIGKGATKLATRAIGKDVVEEMAKQGFKTYVKNNGIKGLGQELGNWAIKAVGNTADDLLVRAPLMTNTVQLGDVASDIIDRKLGDVVVDENGNYDFSNDKTWGSAIWQGEANAIIENFSEMFGAHLDPVMTLGNMSKLANVIGAKRLSNVLAKADAREFNGVMGQTHKLFNKMGVSDYFGEVSEEYYGQLWRTMLNLDDAYQQNPDGTRTNLLATGQFHGDIWGGMALSMGLMGVGKHGLSAANYVSMRHAVNRADARANELLGQDVWEPLRETLDLATNENVGGVAEAIVGDRELTNEEKAAVLTYMERSLNLRGYNLGSIAQSRGAERNEDQQSMNESYIDGYNIETHQEMNDAKNMYEYQRERMKQILREEFLSDIEADPATHLEYIRNADEWSDEKRNTLLDYLNAKQVYEGMMQRVRDDIDGRVEQSNAMVDARVNPSTGMIQGATMKQDDRKVYVVNGVLVQYDDGSVIDNSKSDASIVVRDAETGKLEFVSPDAILNIDQPQDPTIVRQEAAQAIRQQFAQEAADKIDGVVTEFNPGDTYTVTREDGTQAQAQIAPNENGVIDNGDGTVNVTDGTQVFPISKDIIQEQVDAANLARVAAFEQQRAIENAEAEKAAQEAQRPQYVLNDLITLRDENGSPVRGNITANEDADGRFEVYTEAPINGKRVNLFTRDELDAILLEHNGQIVEQPTVEEAEEQPITAETQQPTEQQPSEQQQEEVPQPTALERIPKDEQGNPLYEQADADTAWDALVEEAEGDEEIAAEIVADIVKEREAEAKAQEKALKKVKEGKPETKKGDTPPTMQERIAAKKAAKEAISTAQDNFDKANAALQTWQKIAQTPNRRRMEAANEQSRLEKEAAAQRKAQEEAEAAARAETERIEREALNGVPDMVDDTPQDARARGYRRANGHKVDRQEPIQSVRGKDVEVKFTDSEKQKGNVVLIDASQLQPSHVQGQRNPLHFIDEAQPKDRNDEASVLSAQRIASDINPEEITSSVTAYTGAPTVNARGETIQGNSRSDALRLMWQTQPEQAQKYKQYLKDHAAEFGLNAEDIDKMQNPVLVNMVDVDDARAIALGQYRQQDIESGGVERIQPKSTVTKMGADMRSFANLLLRSASEETSFAGLVDANGLDVLKWMNQRGYITPTQYKSAFDSKGNITAEAKNDLKGIMYQSIFKDGSTRLEEMFNALPSKAQKAILATAYRDFDSPNTERMADEIQNSIKAFYALSQDAAFMEAKNFKEARAAIEMWKRQYQFDDATGESYLPANNFSNFALHLAAMYKGESQSLIQGTFNAIYDLVQGTREESLFENADNTPRTLAQAIKETLNIDYNGQQRSNVLAGDSAASQEGQQGGDGTLAAGERIENGEQSSDSGRGTEGSSGQSELGRQPTIGEKVAEAEAEVNTDPTEAQKEAGNYKKGHVQVGTFNVTIENPKGSVRSGVDANGKKWETTMHNTYGYIRGTEGVDGDHIDVFLSDDIDSWNGRKVFVVDQYNPDGTFDEHKVMFGFNSQDDAMSAYLSNYESGWNENRRIDITPANIEDFEKWIDSSHRKTKAFAEYKSVKEAAAKQGNERVEEIKALIKELKEQAEEARNRSDIIQEARIVGRINELFAEQRALEKSSEATAATEEAPTAVTEEAKGEQPTQQVETPVPVNAEGYEVEKRFHKKNGTYIHAVKFTEQMPRDVFTALKKRVKEFGGYYSSFGKGGFIFDNEADAHKFAQAVLGQTQEETDDAPVSMSDLAAVTDGEVAFSEPKEAAKEEGPVWQYFVSIDKETGYTTVGRDDVRGPIPIGDARFRFSANSPQEMLEILRNPKNGMEEVLEAVGTRIENHIIAREADERMKEKENIPSDAVVVEKPEDQKPKAKNPSGNKIVSDERYAELRERMRKKLGGQLNMGIDPEILAIGAEMAVYHIEKGARKFTDYAKAMIEDLGDAIRPYLKSFYNAVRDMPEAEEAGLVSEMTPYEEVRTFDVANFDKSTINAISTAETVTREAEVEKEADVAKERVKKSRAKRGNNEKKAVNSQQSNDLFGGLFDNNNEKDKEHGLQGNDAVRSEGVQADSNRHEKGLSEGVEGSSESREEKGGRTDNGGKGKGDAADRAVRPRLSGTVEKKNTNNNHSERGANHAPTSVDARIDANIKAIELAQRLIENDEKATPEQMAVLRKFSGWGGLGKAFSDNVISKRIRELLGEEAYQQAVMSANSAYYTPAYVVDTLWDIAEKMGFKGGNILEGSAGIGNILGQMPTGISENSDIRAIEIDGTSGGILSLLYPDAQVEIQGFEQTRIPNGSVDLAITNVPFVTGLRVNDTTGDNDLSKKFHNIHDFCIAKNVRKLREGGLGIFITSNGTLDNSKKLRDWITNEGGADFIGAFRMNNRTFGGTGVTSDIIVIRKRVNGQKSPNAIDVSTITGERMAEYDTGETRKVKGKETPVIKQLSMDYNRYFVEHPENMAGEMHFAFEKGDTFRPTSKGLYPAQGKNQEQMLSDFVQSFKEESDNAPRETEESTYVADASADGKRLGELYVKDGKLVIASFGGYYPLSVNANKVKGHTKVECFNAYAAIKQALADVLSYQTEHEDDKGLKPLLDKLNKAYDDFVNTYGHFNKNTAIAFLRNDVDYPNVFALEKYEVTADENGNFVQKFGKTDVFSQRVVEKEKEPNPTNVKDGIVASLFKYGRIDVPYIAEQLGESVEDVKRDIINNGYGFEDPATRQLEVSYQYLSGNVREKLRQAEENNENGEYDKNIKALQEVLPMNIPAHLIDFTLGSSWIDPKLYNDYVKERTDIDVQFTPVGGTWYMKAPEYGLNKEKNRSMGIVSEQLHKTIMGHTLIEAAIQNKTITVSQTYKHYDGTTETITDKEATQACAAKIDEIRQDFKEWARQRMQGDSEMSERMERIYNDTFNNYVPMSIPDDFVPEYFGGASHKFKMRPHQGKAIVRGTMQPLLLAHEVGTGKTFTLISTAMEMRRLGTARKPMIVVQNATVGQFVASAKALYPNAKILTLEEADRSAEGRKNFYAKIRYNDWDMIVVPQSTFEFIPDSEERQMAFIHDKIEEKLLVLEQMKEADPDGKSMITRQAEREIADLELQLAGLSDEASKKRTASDEKKRAVTMQNAEVKAQEMLDRRTDDVENFDEMGIDALLVDEAHEYKHLGFATAMQRGVKGVDPSYSKKSQGVYLKTQAVLEKNNGRNVIFATGTPISNTAAEIWTFMRYLMPADTMKEYGIYYFDDFVRNFGNIQQMLEFTTSAKFKENNRFAGYVNLPELVRIWSGVSDTVLTKEAGGVQDKIPELETGKAQDIYLPQTLALRGIMKYVKEVLERYENMSGKEKKENSHIPLTMYGIAKAAAVDARLVQEDAEDDTNSKTNEAVRQTLRSLKETEYYKGTIAIFADNYQNKHSGFNLYEDIREKLIAEGVPSEQIVVIKSGMTVKKKLEIFDKVNRGEVRVIMGSTYTLGTGVNIQEHLHTLIHLDAPNRPMDYTQRNGRILRQGNLHKDMNKPVRVLRFGVEDSLDVTAYQRLKTKGAIADSIMNGKQMMSNSMTNRVLEEEEDVFGDTVAQLSGSEYAMLKNNAEKNVRKYRSRKTQWEADQTYIHNAKPRLRSYISEAERRSDENRKYLKAVREAFKDGKFSEIVIGKNRFTTIDEMADFFKEQNKNALAEIKAMKEDSSSNKQERELAISIGGYTFKVKTVFNKEMTRNGASLFAEVHRQMTYSCPELGLKDVPVKQSLLRNAIEDITENVITGKDFEERAEAAERSIVHYKEELEQLLSRDGKPFEFEKELAKAQEQLEEYTELMKKELAEKEAKYAEMDAEVQTAGNISSTEEDDDTLYRSDDEGDIEEVNRRFNEELQQQIDGTLPNGHIYQLGRPSIPLLAAGFPDAPIELSATRLAEKAKQRNHIFELADMENLADALQRPIAVFAYGDKAKAQNVIVELEKDGKKFVVGVHFNQSRHGAEVSDIRGLFNKDSAEWLNWITQGKLLWVDKEKIQTLITKQRTNLAEVGYLDLDYATKIVENFENPSVVDEKTYREGVGSYTDDEVIMENDPVSKVLGEPRRTMKQRRELAARERRRMVDHVNELAKKLNLDNVEVVTDASKLDPIRRTKKGFFSKSTGKITIVIPNHASVTDVEQTLLHEAVAHYGLRKLFGEHFDTFLDNVFNNADEAIRRRIVDLATKNGWDFRKATEEYLAGLAENTEFENVNASWWNMIKSFFLNMLHQIGFENFSGVTLTDNELRYILWRSYENLREPGSRRSILGEAEDVARQYEWKVGNYAEHQQDGSTAADDTLFRDGDPEVHERELARDRYEQRVKTGMFQTVESMQDSMLGLEEAMAAILGKRKDFRVEEVADFENPYLGENRLSSMNEKEAYAADRTLFKPMLKEVAKLAPTKAARIELMDYMFAKHGLERNPFMAKRDFDAYQKEHPYGQKTLQDFRERDYAGLTALTGMQDVASAEAEAQLMVDDYEQSHDTAALWNSVNAVSKAILQKSYESGLMDKKTFDYISGMYQFYIPLRGFDEETSAQAYAYLTHKDSAFNAPIKTARGRGSKADDPFANLESMMTSVIMQGNRNRLVKQRFLNFVLNHPSDLVSVSELWVKYNAVEDSWEAVFPDNIDSSDTADVVERKMQNFETRMQSLAQQYPDLYKRGKDAVDVPYRVVEARDMHQHQVVVKRNGRDYVITINGNPRAAQALNGQTNPDNHVAGSAGAIIGAVGYVNRGLSSLYTTLQPDFVASNFVRDCIYSNTMAWIKESPNYALKYNLNYAKLNPIRMKMLFAKYRKGTLDMGNKTEAMFKLFLDNGGETGYARMLDIDQHKKKIDNALKALNQRIPLTEIRKYLGEWIGEVGRAIETQARFAAFMTSRDFGRDVGRSVWDAKEISVNFNKKGSGDRFFRTKGQTLVGNAAALTSGVGRAHTIFWNAAIQGTFGNFIKNAKRHPAKVLAAAAVWYGLATLITALGASGGDDDDDEHGSYYDIPEHVRRNNLVIKGPGKSWIKIPLPIEYRAVYGMGELCGTTIFHNEPLTVHEMLAQFTQLTPIDILAGQNMDDDNEDGVDWVAPLIPSAFKPLYEVGGNRSWTGLPIYKDTPWNKNMPEWTKAYKNANKQIVDLCAFLNDATGGTHREKGGVDWNPAKIEYLLRGYGGGFWTLTNQLVNIGETAFGDRDFDWRNIPLVNRVITNGDERTQYRAVNNEYFRLKKEHDETMRLIRGYESDERTGVFDVAERIDFLYNSPAYERALIFEDYKPDLDILNDELKETVDKEERKAIEAEMNELKKGMISEMNETRK